MDYQFIRNDQELEQFSNEAAKADAVAIDTEFVRTRTLYPRLGLIQVFDGKRLVLIDPLEISDWSAFNALLTNSSVIKILHSCSEDLETFWHNLGVVPSPIFDTQFAACLLNMGATLGYANLVELTLGVQLDKGESRTDWLARPLSAQQCQYAANDVLYLYQLFPDIYQKIKDINRLEWIFNEMEALSLKKTSQLPTQLAYLSIKNNWQLHGRSLYILQQLAKWRVEKAMKKDMALNFVVKEQNLVEIAKRQPTHKGALFKLQGIAPQEARVHGDEIVNIINEAKDVPPEMYPPAIERLIEYPGFKKIVSSIRQLCQEQADALNIPVEILGSKKQIHQVLKWAWFEQDETRELGVRPDLLSGWRQPLLQSGIESILGKSIKE